MQLQKQTHEELSLSYKSVTLHSSLKTAEMQATRSCRDLQVAPVILQQHIALQVNEEKINVENLSNDLQKKVIQKMTKV